MTGHNVDLAGVCTGPGPCVTTPMGAGKNWVTDVGGLPLYIRAIAQALRRNGHSESNAIQLAVGTVKRWARGEGNVTAATRARAAAALAEWERKKAQAHSLSTPEPTAVDLAVIYHWKHGWIPLTHQAALSKAHGSHAGAARILTTHGQHEDAQRMLAHGLAKSAPGSKRRDMYRQALAKHMQAHGTLIGPNGGSHGATTPTPVAGIHVEHTGDGTLVLGTSRGDGTAPILKQHGFRWSSNIGAWYLPRTQTEPTRRMKARQAHAALTSAGLTAHITEDAGNTTSAAERETQARERSAARAERLTQRAAKLDTEAEGRYQAAHAIMDRIPMGQPILVGHHSERGHRADLRRIDSHLGKMSEAMAASRDAERRAEAARKNATRSDSPLARIRRVERNEAEIRKIDRTLAQHDLATRKPDAAARVGVHPLTADHHEQLRAERARLADQVQHDKAQVEQSGHAGIRAADITPGDVIHYRGRTHLVTKVNKTTVSVPSGYSWDDKVPLSQVTKHVKVESTARLEEMLADPHTSDAMKNAAGRILAARAAKRPKKKPTNLTAPQGRAVDLAAGAMTPLPGTSRPRFPIRNHGELKKAIRAVGRAKGDHAKVRRHIISRAKAIGGAHLIPDHWNSDGSVK